MVVEADPNVGDVGVLPRKKENNIEAVRRELMHYEAYLRNKLQG